MNSGLYERPGVSATRNAAASANWLEAPFTNASNVYRGFMPPVIAGIAEALRPLLLICSVGTGACSVNSCSSESATCTSTTNWRFEAPISSNASRTSGRYRDRIRSRVCPLGAPTRSIEGSLSSEVTSWKVENQTASETCARSSCATAVHNWSWSLTCTSVSPYNRCPHNCPHDVDNPNSAQDGDASRRRGGVRTAHCDQGKGLRDGEQGL